MVRDKFTYSHGDNGTKPSSSIDFQKNQRPDSEHFDWWWTNVIDKTNKIWDELDRLDNDDDGVVDTADYANDADASTYKGNDIDSDGDGKVDNADQLDGNDGSFYEGGGGGWTVSGFDLDNGNAHPFGRFAGISGETLQIDEFTLANENFNAPSGLSIIVYDHTNSTELFRYTGTSNLSLNDSFSFSGEDVAFYVDNGDSTFGHTGSGSTQTITASLNARFV